MAEIDFSYIRNKASDAVRLADLAKTTEGNRLIKQIAASEINRLINTTEIDNVNNITKVWRENFTDIVRPNRFSTILTAGGEFYDLSNFVKTISIPSIERNSIIFKRCGKTIKLPLNIDTPNSLSLSFYQDVDNKVFSDIIYMINSYNYDFVNYNDVENRASYGSDLALFYPVKMHVDPKNLTDDFWNKLLSDAIQAGVEYGAKAIVGNMNYDVLQNALGKNGLQNTGNKETVAKYFNNFQFFNFTFKIVYKNIFIDSLAESTYDMEKQNTYQEMNITLHYQDMLITVYELDLTSKNSIKGEIMNSTDFSDNLI